MTTEMTTARAERVEAWQGYMADRSPTDDGKSAALASIDLAERNSVGALEDGDTAEALAWALLGALRAMRRA